MGGIAPSISERMKDDASGVVRRLLGRIACFRNAFGVVAFSMLNPRVGPRSSDQPWAELRKRVAVFGSPCDSGSTAPQSRYEMRSDIPTGLWVKAQGCEGRATLGLVHPQRINTEGVVDLSVPRLSELLIG